MDSLEGNALVTGGSRGIGRSCALALARRGADVAITYVANSEAAERTAAEIRALGRRAVVIQGDVGVVEDNVAAVEKAIEGLGPLRYLVANAANGSFGLTGELTVEEWDYTMAAHVRSLLVLAQTASATMRENGGGAIVAISSLGAHRVYDAYAAFGTA
jgi:NAD(P)-dependent dehydrogenase (short-subunit alcohol dehydrogenase family)